MTQSNAPASELIVFLRKRDYRLVRELGQGACGKTVLLYDDQIDEHFVCKKYAPRIESERATLFSNFVREIKLLHQVNHNNVVRVFNYYLYPEQLSGYILMEYVDGSDIQDHIRSRPEEVNELFVQAISGFSYLERCGILHRDIRPRNLLVTHNGLLKIIDFGFGKRVQGSADFDKSITLNWWCPPPSEFSDGRYDFATEVYFVGKLFEAIIQENAISHFKFATSLARMCIRDAAARVQSFTEIERSIQSAQIGEIGFEDEELQAYRAFADAVSRQLTKIEKGAKYVSDAERIQAQLSEAYRNFMLEENVPDAAVVLRCLVQGNYYYRKIGLPTYCVGAFVRLLRSSPAEKRRILLANLCTRLDAIQRYSDSENDDVPF